MIISNPREMAEKLAIEALSVHYTPKFLNSPSGKPIINKAVNNIIKEVEQLLADKERLDWLEKCRASLNCVMGAPGNYHFSVGTHPSEHNYRLAIDNAMKEGK